jgi:23S rRNA pseudouridine1911/1915/1917 synthase
MLLRAAIDVTRTHDHRSHGVNRRVAKTRVAASAVTNHPSTPTIAAVVRQRTGVAWSRARDLCESGRVTVNGERWVDAAMRVPEDALIVITEHAARLRKGPLSDRAIVFFDRDIVIVDKPAGMLTVADETGNKDTLADHARTLLRRLDTRGIDARLGVVHRLDKDTSGLMVFARTADAKRVLADRFRAHDIDRVYRAIAHGAVAATRVDSHLLLDRGDGLRGSHGHFRRTTGAIPADAKRSVTFVTPIAVFTTATLVECRLETGRQHQIRIHLSELGHPLVGERVYIRDYSGTTIASTRPMLHAHLLGFVHPRSGERLSWQREPPDDFLAMLESLQTS